MKRVVNADPQESAAALLRGIGQRVTRPRVVVLSQLVAAGTSHMSADEVHEAVLRDDAGVHRATVYRTLEGLTDAGVLDHVHLDRGLTAYHLSEAAGGGHLHAQCTRCGCVVDLPADALGDSAKRIRKATGFQLNPAHVALSGICRICSGK